jgi:hypothetical protein
VVDAEGCDVTSLGHEDEDGTVSCLGLVLEAAKMPHCPRAKRVRELHNFPVGNCGTLNFNKAEITSSFQKKIETSLLCARLGLCEREPFERCNFPLFDRFSDKLVCEMRICANPRAGELDGTPSMGASPSFDWAFPENYLTALFEASRE